MASSCQEHSLLQSVQNGLQVLKLFTEEKPVWGITDIARELQLPKSTVSRLLGVLIREDFIEKIGTKYRLGLSLLKLTGVIKSHMEIKREAVEPLQSLVEKTGETALISILEGAQVIYLHKIECKQPVKLQGDIGKSNPASCASSGKLLLAHHPKKGVEYVLQGGLPKLGPNSVTDPQILADQLRKIKQKGYSICIDEMHENVISIAAPVRDYMGQVVSSVSIVGPKQRMTKKSIPYFVDEIRKTAQTISYRLGYLESVSYG